MSKPKTRTPAQIIADRQALAAELAEANRAAVDRIADKLAGDEIVALADDLTDLAASLDDANASLSLRNLVTTIGHARNILEGLRGE